MKDKILLTHPTLGIITYEDLIRDLGIMLTDSKFFEDIVYQTLKNTELDDEDISTYFNFSIINRLEWILDVLKSAL